MDELTYGRGLFQALRDHVGPDPYGTVLVPWLRWAEGGYCAELAEAAGRLCRETFDGPAALHAELSWELYALSRVSDVMLLAHQPPGDTTDAAWAERARTAGERAAVDLDAYVRLFTGVGMVPFEESSAFDPFLHEIVEVDQAEDPEEPIRVTEVLWPGLWLGPLLFSRAGVRVRAGARHAERGVADRFPLYWTYLRRHRPTVDLSQGWGHNSQWRTDFRLDYVTRAGERRVNGDGFEDIDAHGQPDALEALLTPMERRQFLRNRCLLRTPVNAAALAATPSWEREFFPFDWRLPAAESTPPT